MNVYGDHDETFAASDRVSSIRRTLETAEHARGLTRHALLVQALIDAGQLWQALEDGGHAGEVVEVAAWTMEMGRAVVRSWDTCFVDTVRVGRGPELAEGLSCRARIPEGFLHYALYVEGYVDAARRLPAGPWRVVGVRSVGTSLAALVAVVLGAPVPRTVRPIGEPFRRRLSSEDTDRLPRAARVAVVDEGPGLSGSTLLAVADALRSRGCTVHLMPGHSGSPGWAADPTARSRWDALPRQPASGEAVWKGAGRPDRSLCRWLEEHLGPIEALDDVSAGRWRAHLRASTEAALVAPREEQLKLLARSGGERWLVKFSGLGRWGAHRFELASMLGRAGWSPPPVAQVHGFTVTPWRGDCRPFSLRGESFPRDRALRRAAGYLAFRAIHLRAPEDVVRPGLGKLWDMAVQNAAEALGPLARTLGDEGERLWKLESQVHPVAQDGRLQPHEWIVTPGGTLLKTDATEHHLGHDLVGPQDIGWDVAGLEAEWELDPHELRLVETVIAREAGRRLSPELLDVYRVVYRAFRMGQLWMGAESVGRTSREGRRLESAALGMRERLAGAVERWTHRTRSGQPSGADAREAVEGAEPPAG